jgi:hypothetical protein
MYRLTWNALKVMDPLSTSAGYPACGCVWEPISHAVSGPYNRQSALTDSVNGDGGTHSPVVLAVLCVTSMLRQIAASTLVTVPAQGAVGPKMDGRVWHVVVQH